MTDVDLLLERARQLIQLGWCRDDAIARDDRGRAVHPFDPYARTWSIHGALLRASRDLALDTALATARDLVRDRLWDRHQLYLMTADCSPLLTRRTALDVLALPLQDVRV